MKRTFSKLDHNAAAIKRWRSKLKRAMTTLEKLERQRKRLEVAEAKKVTAVEPPPPPVETATVVTSPVKDEGGIPDFLRVQPRSKADQEAADELRQEQEERKRAKARGRIEKLKAKKSGETRKMPLSGRAALAHIRQE